MIPKSKVLSTWRKVKVIYHVDFTMSFLAVSSDDINVYFNLFKSLMKQVFS